MKITIERSGTLTTLSVSGRLDSVTAPEFDHETATVCQPGSSGDIIIDCSALEYISSAGLRSFITILKRAKASDRNLEIHNLSDSLRSIFDMTGFTSIFKIK